MPRAIWNGTVLGRRATLAQRGRTRRPPTPRAPGCRVGHRSQRTPSRFAAVAASARCRGPPPNEQAAQIQLLTQRATATLPLHAATTMIRI